MSKNKKQIYLDYAATHPLSSATKEYIISLLDMYGNPSSQYELSDIPRKVVFDARQTVANFINTQPENIIFTSGGSASNSLGIKGYLEMYPDTRVYYSPIAHKSIIKCMSDNYYPLIVNKTGMICLSDFLYVLKHDKSEHKLVIVDYANSELGTIQEINDIVRICHKNNAIVMIDATGSISTIPLDVKKLDADIVTFSGHKLGALKGIGVLYKKPEIEIKPLICGAQEQGLFAGTENVIGIASLYSAITEYDYITESFASETLKEMWNYLGNIPNTVLLGNPVGSKNRLCNNLFICFKGVDGEILTTLLSSEGIYVSTGSACNSGSKTPSVAVTLGLEKQYWNDCIRITINHELSMEDALYACKVIKGYVEFLRK